MGRLGINSTEAPPQWAAHAWCRMQEWVIKKHSREPLFAVKRQAFAGPDGWSYLRPYGPEPYVTSMPLSSIYPPTKKRWSTAQASIESTIRADGIQTKTFITIAFGYKLLDMWSSQVLYMGNWLLGALLSNHNNANCFLHKIGQRHWRQLSLPLATVAPCCLTVLQVFIKVSQWKACKIIANVLLGHFNNKGIWFIGIT